MHENIRRSWSWVIEHEAFCPRPSGEVALFLPRVCVLASDMECKATVRYTKQLFATGAVLLVNNVPVGFVMVDRCSSQGPTTANHTHFTRNDTT